MKSVLKAIEYETMRQRDVLDRGETVDRETRLWDEVNEKSARMRSKEESQDYRYFPEPDLVPVLIDEKWLRSIKDTIPELPLARRQRFIETFALSGYDASLLIDEKIFADFLMHEMNRPKSFCGITMTC
jgi:aspartyl-tRNA(Asn)/glutamyl-tRNA(Gln) amidotransferase subunit B